MSNRTRHEFDSDADTTPIERGQISSNGHWVFGSIFAGLVVVGFGFGVWAGASKPKPAEVADAKKDKDTSDKGGDKSGAKPATPSTTPTPASPPPIADPKPSDPDPKPKEPDPKPKDPDPKPIPIKPKEPDPKPKDPDPKNPDIKAVAFKAVQPILRARCNTCHGDVGKPKGGVDLRTMASIKKGDKDGSPLVVPGSLEKSPLYESITSERMPKDGKPPPSPEEMLVLRNWILSGAKERRRRGVARVGRRRRPRGRMELTASGDAG